MDGVSYTHDDRGNLVSNGTLTYTHNSAGRMVSVQGGATISYTYNGDGLRVGRTAGGSTTDYVWDLAADLPQMLADGETVYVPGIGYHDGEHWTYTLPDGLGSVRQLADAQGYLVGKQNYSPFGQLAAGEGERTNPLGFAGEYQDGDMGLVYLRARWYDPSLGRFLSRDPFPGLATLPQTQHDTVYVGNNPVNLTDPSGEIAPLAVMAIAGGVGGVIGAVGGGVSYVLAHPGGRVEDTIRSGGFWRSVGVGAASGAVAGSVGWLVPSLLPAAGSLWGAMGIGALSGAAAGGAGQLTANALNPCMDLSHNLGWAVLGGGVAGGVLGGAGYSIRQWIAARSGIRIDWSDYPSSSKVPRPRGQFRILEGAEYDAARAQANAANRAIHQANPSLRRLHIHEIHPVKFGGSPTDLANKVFLTPSEHIRFTNWWNALLRKLVSQ